jgi:hypothetical protein
MEDIDNRLSAAIITRNKLQAEAQRIAGRKEAADRTLKEVEEEIISKNLDPASLSETLDTLTEAYKQEVASFEVKVSEAKTALTPYMEST